MTRSHTGLAEILWAVAIRWRLIVCLMIALFALAFSAILHLPTKYSATALIEVAPMRPELTGDSLFGAAINDTMIMNTESGRISSEEMARAVYQRIGKTADNEPTEQLLAKLIQLLPCGDDVSGPPAYAFWCDNRLESLQLSMEPDVSAVLEADFVEFRKNLSANNVRGSRLIEIGFDAETPVAAAQGANAFAEEYLRRKVAEKSKLREETLRWIETRLAELGTNVARAEEEIAAYQSGANLIEMGKEVDGARRTPTVEELAAVLTQLSTAKATRADAQTRLGALADLRANPDGMAITSEIENSAIVRDLLLQEASAQHRIAELSTTYGERHPLIGAARAEIGELQAKLDLEIRRVLAGAEQQYRNADAVVERLTTEVATLQSRAAIEQQARVGLRDLERRASAEAQVYSNFLRLAQEVTTNRSWSDPGAAIVSAATPPSRPTFPNKRLMLPLGLIASASLAILLAVGLELRRQSQVFVDPRDLADATGQPVICAVPWVRRRSVDDVRDFSLAIEDIAFRLCRVTASRERDAVTVAITSSLPGEGKSVLAVSLGRALVGSSNARVLLVDADLRLPRVHRLLGTNLGKTGTESALGRAAAAIRTDRKTGLHALALGDVDDSPVAALASLPQLLEEASDQYDFVVVDTPPLLAVSDAFTALEHCQQTLFAVRWAKTPKSSVDFALAGIDERTRARISLAFTMVDRRAYSAYGAPGSERYRYKISKSYRALSVKQDHLSPAIDTA